MVVVDTVLKAVKENNWMTFNDLFMFNVWSLNKTDVITKYILAHTHTHTLRGSFNCSMGILNKTSASAK